MLNKKKVFTHIFEVCLLVLLLAIDLLTKSLVFKMFKENNDTSIVVLDKMFTLIKAENYGASFGIFTGKTTLLTIITVIPTIAIAAFLIIRPNTNKMFRIGLILILAGALGNIVDRIKFGFVRDFIDYTFLKTMFNIDFAIGNVADDFLLVGVFVLIVYIIFEFEEKDFYGKKKMAKYLSEQEKCASSIETEKVDDEN